MEYSFFEYLIKHLLKPETIGVLGFSFLTFGGVLLYTFKCKTFMAILSYREIVAEQMDLQGNLDKAKKIRRDTLGIKQRAVPYAVSLMGLGLCLLLFAWFI